MCVLGYMHADTCTLVYAPYGIWMHFQLFVLCILQERVELPIDSNTLAKYVVYLHLNGCAYSTAKLHLSVINFAHSVRNMACPGVASIILKLMKGYRNLAKPVSKTKPIHVGLLKKIVLRSTSCLDAYTACLFNVLCVWLYRGNLRVGELIYSSQSDHILKARNVFWFKPLGNLEGIVIRLESYKHSRGALANLYLPRQSDTIVCPLTVLLKYLKMRKHICDKLFVTACGSLPTSTWFLKILRFILQKLKESPLEYSTHSFRVGYTTDLALHGTSHTIIQMRGRWKSDAYQKYIRPTIIPM